VCPRGLRRGSADARFLGLWVRIPPGTWISVVDVVCCVGSSRWDGLITLPGDLSLVHVRVCVRSGTLIILYTYIEWVEVRLKKNKERKKKEVYRIETYHLRCVALYRGIGIHQHFVVTVDEVLVMSIDAKTMCSGSLSPRSYIRFSLSLVSLRHL